ncbi:hypothetical protein CEUSTIGMA_g13216.t1 [Chlamydomonas eustigma]|uniref:DUF6851 domain-containing protein n=1 Tax=Chlamydomonas eustigma TaxID=1157962 RepID=A0A250XRS9_9CHLO|nr:hypothetical protein CEUSTIGMA_g13216.t1 [Chlamydomonas eustigma]|eukprot:GAX85801.1 hypothetical protein CEUSTIGMA_g13216.t1 [Chlamydomonas eustigma]
MAVMGMYVAILRGYQNAALETPYLIRDQFLSEASTFDALIAFQPTAVPYAYAPGYGLPFKHRLTGPQNTTQARNTAIAHAFYRVGNHLYPKEVGPVLAGMLTSLGLDPSYSNATNLTDPRDIGNAVGFAISAYSDTDGTNSKATSASFSMTRQPASSASSPSHMDVTSAQSSSEADPYSSNISSSSIPIIPYTDYTGFAPSNTAYQLSDITKWQPLMESDSRGY